MAPNPLPNSINSNTNNNNTINNNNNNNNNINIKESKLIGDDAILVDNNIYFRDEFAKHYPGGELFVDAFGDRDATEAFISS